MAPVHTPFWWEGSDLAQSGSQNPPLKSVYDAIIIGGGLTGLSAARTFTKAGREVLVLEASRCGMGASSRNGGMVGGGHALSFEDLSQQHGKETALSLIQEAHVASTAFVQELIADETIDCRFEKTGRLRGFSFASDYEKQARMLEALQSLIDLDAEILDAKASAERLNSPIYHGALLLNQHGGLNPAAFVRGLMKAAIAKGATVRENANVLHIEQETNSQFSVSVQTETEHHSIKTSQVLMATNGYTPQWAKGKTTGQIARRIIPVPSFLIATEPLGKERIKSLFPGGHMCVETGNRHSYFRPSPCGERIIMGARAALVNIKQDRATRSLTRNLKRIFSDLGSVKISHSWTGSLGFAFDHMPNISNTSGVWHAVGYSGNGNTMAPYLGHKAAHLMMGNRQEGRTAFTKTPLPSAFYYGGALDAKHPATPTNRPAPKSPWFMPVADLWWRMKDFRG